MFSINYFTAQRAQQTFISAIRHRDEITLVGALDGVNTVFRTPWGEKFVQNIPYYTISVYYNGLKLELLDDFMISESGGVGTGYDTVTLMYPPMPNDNLSSDYLVY